MDLSINEGTLVVAGGTGDSLESAIIIKKTPKGLSAAGAEHLFLTKRFGQRGVDWALVNQDLLRADGKVVDAYRVRLADASERMLYFDVTAWLMEAQRGNRPL
jgi:hypothetical protein